MHVDRRTLMGILGAAAAPSSVLAAPAPKGRLAGVSLSPDLWRGDYDRYLAAQTRYRTTAGTARGRGGAVTVAYSGLAARSGLEALKRGGNAIDAAMTTAMMQIVLTAGAPISFFGIMSLVYYDARTRRTSTMNAEWNTVRGETDPLTIPGKIDLNSSQGILGSGPHSGRTALVGGFLKGVEAAHRRFGRLPFASLFEPSIYAAETGFPVNREIAKQFVERRPDLARLPETRDTFLKPGGEVYTAGEIFRQPALAQTLRRIAAEGTGHVYGGEWGEKAVRAIQADGGRMTLEDLKLYDVQWADPLIGGIGNGYSVHTNPAPNAGGVSLIEAQNLAWTSGLASGPHWTTSGEALAKANDICGQMMLSYLPPAAIAQIYPGVDMSPEARVTEAHAKVMWEAIQSGRKAAQWIQRGPMHSDDVVVIDAEGNIAAITHSINCVTWGKTAITVGGLTIGDPGSFQQAQIAQVPPGGRLPAPTETGIVFKGGRPVLGFASMGSGLHQRTFQGLLNMTAFGMNVEEAVNTADFYIPSFDAAGRAAIQVPTGRFSHDVLDDTGYAWREVPLADARMAEGKWVAIARDPSTGDLYAASHNRNNSAAVAF